MKHALCIVFVVALLNVIGCGNATTTPETASQSQKLQTATETMATPTSSVASQTK